MPAAGCGNREAGTGKWEGEAKTLAMLLSQ
jgi:hypothetical protein